MGIVVDSRGNLVFSEGFLGGGTTSVLINSATVARLAPNGVTMFCVGSRVGPRGGAAGLALFGITLVIAVDARDNAFVVDGNIGKVTTDGTVTTVAGNVNGNGVVLGALPGALSFPNGIAIDLDGVIYVLSAQAVFRIVLQ